MTNNSINTNYTVNAAQELLQPTQPAFLVIRTSTGSNVTGDGTAYTIVFQSEIKDVGSDFDGTSTFTSPLTGMYSLNSILGLSDIGTQTTFNIWIQTSNRKFTLETIWDIGAIKSSSNTFVEQLSTLTDMDAADTAYCFTKVSGGTKTIDVYSNGATDPYTCFSGRLEV